jgi:methylglyoxal synthase
MSVAPKAARVPKRIALIAHDHKKDELLAWCRGQREVLAAHVLLGTGTTGTLLGKSLALPVTCYKSGPLGGDQQIGALIAEGGIDLLFFFWDPLDSQPHDPDVKALLRMAVLWNIPTASNEATADFLVSSPLFQGAYDRVLPDYTNYRERYRQFQER